MSNALYKDVGMRAFVCAADNCSIDEFFSKVKFEGHIESYKGVRVDVCLVAPILTARNSYVGIFAKNKNIFNFQFISFGTGILVKESEGGLPILIEGGDYDPSGDDNYNNLYLWDGSNFIFKKQMRR